MVLCDLPGSDDPNASNTVTRAEMEQVGTRSCFSLHEELDVVVHTYTLVSECIFSACL